MQDQLTDHLDQQLESTSLENFSDYLKNLQQLPSLQDFFSVYIAKHDLKISQIIKNSGISQSYAHEILKQLTKKSRLNTTAMLRRSHGKHARGYSLAMTRSSILQNLICLAYMYLRMEHLTSQMQL